MELYVDAESYSDRDLKRCGSWAYAQDPSTEVIIWSVRAPEWPRALPMEQPRFWHLLEMLRGASQLHWTRDEPLEIYHWGAFDRLLVEYGDRSVPFVVSDEGIHTVGPAGRSTRWIDLREVSLCYGAPASLSAAAEFWLGPSTTGKDPGKLLISRFCKPQKNGRRIRPEDDPVRWARFLSYAAQDADLLPLIAGQMRSIVGGFDWKDHQSAQASIHRMNALGLPVDRESVKRAAEATRRAEMMLVDACQKEFGFTPSQTEQVRQFLGTADVRKETLEALVADEPEGSPRRRVAEIRLELAGAARKKLLTLETQCSRSYRVQGGFGYHGAWTRRLTAGGVQPQNFVRAVVDEGYFDDLQQPEPVPDLFERTRKNIRGFLAPPRGDVLVAADYNAIELRVGAWIAREKWLLKALRENQDVYCLMADKIFGQRTGTFKKGDPERDLGKTVELGALYGLGGAGLHTQLEARGLAGSFFESKRTIEIYRQTHQAIERAWKVLGAMWLELVDSASGAEHQFAGCRLERHPLHIKVVRPSGFAQFYWLPRTLVGRWPDGGERLELAYTGRGMNGKMSEQRTYGGNIFQGIVQGTAADLMLHAMQTVERAGFYPVMSVHDEIVCELRDDGRSYVDRLCKLLCELPDWAKGLPVVAEGWQGPRFTKG